MTALFGVGSNLGGIIPAAILTDSYKTSHYYLYPDALKMVAYGEFRAGYEKDALDTRIVFYGIRYIIEHYVAPAYTEESVERAATFFLQHCAGATPFPFPKDLFLKFVRENGGHFPVKIEALPEGSVIYPHVPVYVITAEGEYSRLVTYLETLLTMVWYPSTVATLSRRARDRIEAAYTQSVDPDGAWTLTSRLHDFGFRGCTSVEQSVIGGCAHLLNFNGTDTLSAAYYAQFHLNSGRPVGFSIPATEHSVMTAHKTESAAMRVLFDQFGGGVCACVMDSYDYANALDTILPSLASQKVGKGGFLVIRPDSGDPVEVVLQGLRALEKIFGATVNAKGFKVIKGAGVIQGDGINIKTLQDILKAVTAAGYSAQSVAFGMGGGLLQKVNRDTMSFATKLCKITYADGSDRNVMKMPKTDASKVSLPGEFYVDPASSAVPHPVVYPLEKAPSQTKNLLQIVYDHGVVPEWEDFDTIRDRLNAQWSSSPLVANVLASEMKEKIQATRAEQERANEESSTLSPV